MHSSKAEVTKDEARSVVKDKRKGIKTVQRGIFGCKKISSMGGEYGASAKKRREGPNVCRLSGFKSG